MKGYKKNRINPKYHSFSYPSNKVKGNTVNTFVSDEKSALLLIDNDKKFLDKLSNFFIGNYKVITTSSGIDALNIAIEENPALIITGSSVADFDGFALCRQIKNNLATCHIPLIILIPKNITDQKIKGYEVGADNIISNPIDFKLLAAQVKRLIQNRILIKEKYLTQNYTVELESKTGLKAERFEESVRKILEGNLADPDFNVQKLAGKMYTSTTQLYRNLKETTGLTPVEYIRMFRLQNAYVLLNQKDISVTEACYQSGFNNVSYFIKCFKKEFGATPSIVMNSYKNDTPRFIDLFSTSSLNHPQKEVVMKSSVVY